MNLPSQVEVAIGIIASLISIYRSAVTNAQTDECGDAPMWEKYDYRAMQKQNMTVSLNGSYST